MCDQVAALTEGLSTDYALVRLFTSVYVCVLLHITLLVESLSTILARVGSGIAVNKQVCRKSAAALEALSTLFALEHLFRAVDRPVLSQADLMSKGLVAKLTGERPRPVVTSPRVNFEPVRRGEHFLALLSEHWLRLRKSSKTKRPQKGKFCRGALGEAKISGREKGRPH